MQSNNNLNTFSVLFLIKGILTLCFAIFFMFYAGLGFFVTSAVELDQSNDMPFNPGIILIVIGAIGLIITVTVGILTILASSYLKSIKNYNFIFAMAVVSCLTGILGILLGVFTLIELSKPEIKQMFENNN
ncbi:hypothetical protein [Winogradskyella vincentii]|uniref:Tetraspanin family protein n=1 Tax=Winogradskyella vincentii TaxID=2877122 RepID=A0ABS7Y5G9_9FLAO|nr:hypothetical protein [Winogradskyella vincentii]MCA0154500.1 hypothetical protein [Winogradskyella vincentii]